MKQLCKIFAFVGLASCFLNVTADDLAEEHIRNRILNAIPQLPISAIVPSAIEGFYEVSLGNGERLFVTSNGEHFIAGDLFSLKDGGFQNLTEAKRNFSRAEKIAAVDQNDKIIFKPTQVKAKVSVFTDVDCGYCRQLHQNMDQYLALGIQIEYLAFPRAGIGSESYDKIVSAWCADDPQEVLTTLKTGSSVSAETCENPVADQFKLGSEVGVTGTPALVLESGQLVPGFIPPAQLAQMLGI